MKNGIVSILLVLSVLVSCSSEPSVKKEVQNAPAVSAAKKTLSTGQQAAIEFCNCTHLSDSLQREDCYVSWVDDIAKDSSIIDSEAKVMGKLMFECDPKETLRVLLLIEE